MRGKIVVAASAAALAAAAVVGAVHAGEVRADAEALAAFEAGSAELLAAAAEQAAAVRALEDAGERAATAHAAGTALAAAADPAMLDDAGAHERLLTATADLAAEAGLAPAADATPATDATDIPTPTSTAPPTAYDPGVLEAPDGRSAQHSAAAELVELAAELRDEADALAEDAADVDDASAAVEEAATALIASAHAKGAATAAPELASQETKDAYAAAVAALAAPAEGADLAALVAAYQSTWAGVLASEATTRAAQEAGEVEPTYINGILIVNKTYALPSWYGDGLTDETLVAFEAMRAEAAAAGHDLYISSGFRSYWQQESVYNGFVEVDGREAADRYSARPGHSEHQSGLTFDLNCICEDFGYQADGQWVAANAHRFGFIVRYPQGKEHITGYIWEPWHLRYLGVDVATAVYQSGLTLEEYLGVTSSYD